MSPLRSGSDLLNEVAHEFAARCCNGEHPSLTEYVEKYPDLAEQIRELFPALLDMEESGSAGIPPTTPLVRAVDRDEIVPRHLGDYRILREVAHGGMGIVYEAVQESLGRHVALKVLPYQGPSGSAQVERFQREARAAARLHHTNIVPVFGVGEAHGVYYYAMQFIQGMSLESVLNEVRRPRSAETAAGNGEESRPVLAVPSDPSYFRCIAQIGMQVAEAMAYAHQQGVLHRDIKPSNLLLDVLGTVWITDFGLAKSEGTEELTIPGDIIGTLRYMAPERFEGRADARSDVFSLGLTLYELATLQPAFAGSERAELIERILHGTPPRPRKLDPRIPRDLETIILKAIAREPRQRYATAEAMADDLRRFLADRPIRARRSPPWELLGRWCRRNPAIASLTAAVAVLLTAAALGSTLAALRLDAELRRSEQAEGGEKRARQDAIVALWEAYRDQAEARSLSRRRGQRFEGLKAVANAARLAEDLNLSVQQQLELRNRAIACLTLPDLRIAQEWDGWPADSARLDFDAALRHYARTDRAGGVWIYRVADRTLIQSFPSGLRNPWPRLSPDGQFVTLSTSTRCGGWRVRDATPIVPEQDCVAHDFSPDGRRLALVSADGTIRLFDLASGQCLRRLKAGPHPIAYVAFHPDGRRLALSHSGGVQVRDLDTGEAGPDLPQKGAERLAWHPEGKTLAVVSIDQAIHLWDVAARREVAALRRWKGGGLRIAFNRTGTLLASYGWEHMLRLWDTRTTLELFHTPARFTGSSLRFSADDHLLAADIEENRIRLWEIACGQECRRLIPNPARGRVPYGPFALHPDGRSLAACTAEGFGLWDTRTGQQRAFAPCEPLEGVLFEPSGTLLTSGPSGIFRWPFRAEAGGIVRIGPPLRLPLPRRSRTQIACSQDGRVLASADGAGGWVLHADRDEQPLALQPHEDAQAVAVSPDGRWIVTGSQHGSGACVWDARTGRLETELLARQTFVRVGFSPDGSWLAARGNGLRLWRVGSWEEGPVLGGIPVAGFAFSPVEKMLATETGDGVLRLVDPETGRDYARLQEPDQVRVAWICFSPDGTQLFTVGAGESAWIRVWDLRALRQQLATLGLDWDLPPYPPAGDPRPETPLRVVVDGGSFPGRSTP